MAVKGKREFGVRSGDAPEPAESDGTFLRSFRAGDTTVRFCEEVDDWIMFWEHYCTVGKDKKSYPCTGDRDECPGCQSADEDEAKASRKYGTTVKLIDRDIYLPVRVPVSVQKKMKTRSERNKGTILTRDYIIIKEGKGFDTEYDVEADRTYTIPEKELVENRFDIQEILATMFDEIWNPEEKKDDDEDEKPARKSRAAAKDEDDEEEEKPARRSRARKEEEPEDEPDDEFTESDLKKMRITELRALARKHGVESEVAELGSKQEIIDALIDLSE